jgi:prepilin-type N-terminal cleavage/methylation domain-containing protein
MGTNRSSRIEIRIFQQTESAIVLSNTEPREAFTLVELLVVIAIIAILAALLLRALSGAKNQAAKTTDLYSFRQIMIAEHIYTTDNRDMLSWPNWDYRGDPVYGHLIFNN